jgi:putative Mn2+ efflux pump MntP
MYFIETILIGISLAMDAFAICLCQGLTTKENKEILALKLGITFGAFQAIMPWLV